MSPAISTNRAQPTQHPWQLFGAMHCAATSRVAFVLLSVLVTFPWSAVGHKDAGHFTQQAPTSEKGRSMQHVAGGPRFSLTGWASTPWKATRRRRILVMSLWRRYTTDHLSRKRELHGFDSWQSSSSPLVLPASLPLSILFSVRFRLSGVQAVANFLAAGFSKQILLSHGIHLKMHLRRFGGAG